MSIDIKKELRKGKINRGIRSTIRHLILLVLAAVWLVPIVWLVATSFSGYRGINFTTFFPESYTLDNYTNVLFHPDSSPSGSSTRWWWQSSTASSPPASC